VAIATKNNEFGLQPHAAALDSTPKRIAIGKFRSMILLAFIIGNSSLEPLLEGLLVPIHIDMS